MEAETLKDLQPWTWGSEQENIGVLCIASAVEASGYPGEVCVNSVHMIEGEKPPTQEVVKEASKDGLERWEALRMEYILPENPRTREEAVWMRDVESCPQAAGGRPRTKATELEPRSKVTFKLAEPLCNCCHEPLISPASFLTPS